MAQKIQRGLHVVTHAAAFMPVLQFSVGMCHVYGLTRLAVRLWVQLRKDIYLRLTPVQRLSVARHPNRPTFLDHVLNITDKVHVITPLYNHSGDTGKLPAGYRHTPEPRTIPELCD